MKINTLITFILIGTIIIGGCTNQAPLPEDTHPILRIGYLSETAFEQRYANLLNLEFPDYRIEIVPMKEAIKHSLPMAEWIQSNQVDLIYVPPLYFKELINNNSLLDLKTYMQKDEFPEESLFPSVMELTKQYGSGNIFGLPSNFYNEVIVYNQDLFDQSQIPYLTDGMSWSEVFNVIHISDSGLSVHLPTPFHMLTKLGQAAQLQWIDAKNQAVTVNSTAWIEIWETVTEAIINDNIHFDNINENHFMSGNRAVALISYEEFKMLEQSRPSFNWAIVTLPSAPHLNGQTSSMTVDGFWAIPSTSSNSDIAWKFIQFFMSDKVAKWDYRSNNGFSSLMKEFSLSTEETDELKAFYIDKPLAPQFIDWPDVLPGLVNDMINKIVTNSLSVDKAVEQLQQQVEQQVFVNQ